MKKSTFIALMIGFFSLNVFGQGSVTITFDYNGYITQCCSANTTSYFCFNEPNNSPLNCGNTTTCNTQNFADPVPAGNIVTQMVVTFYSAGCAGGTMSGNVNGVNVTTVNEANTGCLCSSAAWVPTGSGTATYPCGVTNSGYPYTYGGNNTFQFCAGVGTVCIDRATLQINYVPANQANPASQPGAIGGSGTSQVCPGSTITFSVAAVANATSYNWTVPAGWTINSGQGSTSISVTAGASGGNVCVTASNLCGTSSATCFTVSMATASTAPTSASANPNPICPGNSTTLTASGGTMGTGANYTWYSGSCGGTVVGTGSPLTVSPGSTTTYFVAIAGTCNTTGCASTTVNMGGTQATPGAPAGTTAVCSGTTLTFTTSGSSGATSYNWTVPAGSVINSGQGTTSISVTFGSTGGNVCVDATGGCGTSSAACTAISITSTPATPASITGNNPVCVGNENYSISAVAGSTGYTWSATGAGGSVTGGQGTTAATVNWASAGTGTVSVTANNGCGASSAASFTVLVNPLPSITITPTPTAVCSGSTVTLTATGASTYNWSGGSVTPTTGSVVTDAPTGNTTYAVTGTDANNCVNNTSVNITINPTPTVTVVGSSSQVVCSGGTVNGISFNVTPAGSVTWVNSNTSLGGPDLSNASGSGNIGSYTAPNVGSVTTGVVTANATASGSGCASTTSTQATFTLTINPPPVVGASTVTPAPCGLNTGCIDSVAASGGNPGYTFSWNGGTTFSASSQNCNVGAGSYPLQVKDQNGCIGTGTITVSSVNGPPSPTVTASATNACVGDNVPCSINGPSGTYTYTWSDATGTSTGTTYTVNNIGPAGAYTIGVTATDINGCVSAVNTLTITVNPAPTAPVISGSSSNPLVECQGQAPGFVTVATTGTVTSVPVWYNGPNWVATGTSYGPSTTNPGTTVYTVIDSATVTGCVNASAGNVLTVTVTINPGPAAPILTGSATNPLVECENATPLPITVAPSGTVASVPVWYNGSTYVTTGTSYTPATTPPGTTIYTISDSATATGCLSSTTGNVLTVTVTISAAPTGPVLTGTVTNPYFECEGVPPGAITVATTGTVSSIPVWYNGPNYVTSGTSYSPPTSPPGTTVYTVIDSATVGGCKNISAGNVLSVTVTINQAPTVTGNATVTASCTQPTGGISAVTPSGGTPPYHYQWFNGSTLLVGDTLASLSNVGSGNYNVLVTDSNGCPALSGTTSFTISSSAVVANFSPSTLLGAAPLNVSFANSSTGATVYAWSFGSTAMNPSYTFSNAGTYTVVLVASNGNCTDTASSIIIVDVPTMIVVPNVFSPNGDGVNDEFIIKCTGMKTLTCNIMNRWGLNVYTIGGPNQSWDGALSNGMIASEGTYFYMLEAMGVDGKPYKFQGYLTLVK